MLNWYRIAAQSYVILWLNRQKFISLSCKLIYTVWERQCENEQQLDCPVSVMKKCYPIRVPNCRTVTDIKRRTFQVINVSLMSPLCHILHVLNSEIVVELCLLFSDWE